MNAITGQRGKFYGVRFAGVAIVVIAVWGTLGLQAQALPEAAAITTPTAAIAVPETAIVAPATAVAAPAPRGAAPATPMPAPIGKGTTPVANVAVRSDATEAVGATVAAAASVELLV